MDETSSEQTETNAAEDTSSDRAVLRSYWRRRLALRGLLLLFGMPLLFLAAATVLMIGREVSAPSWVVRTVEARAEEALRGGRLEFGEMKLTVGDDLHPRLLLRNSVLRDSDGIVLARVPRIEGLVSPRGVLKGRILAQEIRLVGAQLNLRRQSDGTVAVSFHGGGAQTQTAENFIALLDQLDRMFESGSLEALEQVSAEGLIINYSDDRAGRNWTVDSGQIALDLRGNETVLRSQVALLSGRDYVTTAEMTYRSPRGSRSAEFGINIGQAAAPDIASQSPVLSWLGVIEAPISGAMRGVIDGDGLLSAINATLQIGEGELKPNAETRPIPFEGARTYLSYAPVEDVLSFDLIEIESDWGRLTAGGKAYLREYDRGWPGAILGQVSITDLWVNPDGLFPEARSLGEAGADFRLRLDPFTLDIGDLVLMNDGNPVRATGQVRAAPEGWVVSLDAAARALAVDRVLDLWPEAFKPRTRGWLADNVLAGQLENVAVGLRALPDAPIATAMTMEFSDATIRYLPDQPEITGAAGVYSNISRRLVLELHQGHVAAPEGGRLDLAGSVMTIPEVGRNPAASFDLAIDGTITAALSVLARPPFNIFANSDLPVNLADGRARVTVDLDTRLQKDLPPEDRIWTASARLSGVRSDVLVPDRQLVASGLDLRADRAGMVLTGPVRLDGVPADVTFSRALGPGAAGTARIEAEVTLDQAFLSAFNIGLPDGMVTGSGRGELSLDLTSANAPGFRLRSDLAGIGLRLPAIGWAKGTGSSGALEVTGQLGDTARIDRLALSAAGLEAAGTIALSPEGGLQRAAFDRVRIGNWFNAPVVLEGRGPGRAAAITIAGGTMDLRAADLGGGNGEGGPIEIALDRLQVTEGIALTDFRGAFTSQGGFSGDFSAAINGQAPVRGTVVPINGRSGVRLLSNDAGSVFRAAGLLRNAYGGTLDLTLRPTGAEGNYDGTLAARELRVRDAPALASLLDAISVVGLLTQLGGQGLLFNDVDAEFRLTPTQVILRRSSAVGPGLGISLDGIYSLQAEAMDFQGVISPFYLLNGLGAILTRPGEGLIGFNFNLQGSVDNPRVLVNPLSALTPGMFREIFRRPPPTVSQ